MSTAVLPNEAIADPRTFTDPAALHGLLARIRKDDPLPFIEAADYAPFWLVSRHSDILEVERNAAQFIPDRSVVEFGLVGKTMHAIDERVSVAELGQLTAIDGRVLEAYFR